jgi:formylglycine-generating enzyme required for sulfatase activity
MPAVLLTEGFSKINRASFRQRGNLFVQDDPGERNVETKTRVFISYSRKDMAFADKLEAALRARGFEVLIDRQEIYAFEDWWARIEALIGGADTVVFVISPESVKSDVTVKEVAYAASLNKRFAPIVCRQVENSAVPEALRRFNFIFFDDLSQFEASADKLTEALQTDIVWIRDHTKFGEAARGWTAAGRPNGLLLRTPALEMAEYWIASRPRGAPEPTDDIRKFVAASRQSARSGQRLRRTVLGSIFTLMTAVILGLVGWINQAYIAAQWHWWTVTRPYAAAQVWPHVLNAAQEQALKPGDSFQECAQACPEMVVLPAGSFTMGNPNQIRMESPLHSVTLAKPSAVSKYELTFDDWEACIAGGGCNGYMPNDQPHGRGKQPVINVSWSDAHAYVAWFTKVTGKTYRLLSEAEYEYAARAGTTTVYPWGDDIKLNGATMANCVGCGGSKWDYKVAPVGSFPPNRFGLYDMVGNIWEWTEDCYHDSYNGAPANGSAWLGENGGDCSNRAMRGSTAFQNPPQLESAHRNKSVSDLRINTVGFRVARTLVAP